MRSALEREASRPGLCCSCHRVPGSRSGRSRDPSPAIRSHLPFRRKVTQEPLDLGTAERARMPQSMVSNEATCPVHVRFRGTKAVVVITNPLAQLIEQAGRLEGSFGAGFHGRLILYIKTVPRVKTVIMRGHECRAFTVLSGSMLGYSECAAFLKHVRFRI